MIRNLLISAAASVVNAADPCGLLCDAMPGACGPAGSRCVGETCTDLFWREYFSTLCNSSIEGCPDIAPVECSLAATIAGLEGHLGVTVYVPGPDPCPVICDAIPNACGPDGSRCVDGVCSDLFWWDFTTLCNSSILGCPDTSPLSCATAEPIGQAPDHLGVGGAAEHPDFCSALCDSIPGACGPNGSRCVDQVCTDLFWMQFGVICNSSIEGCLDRDPLTCQDAGVIDNAPDHYGVVAATAAGDRPEDPCSAICDELPGACGPDGSRCINRVCTDLFWSMDLSSLCNPSIAGCPDTSPLTCGDADAIVQSEDHLGVHAAAPRAVELFDFAPGTGIVGRRGFENVDSTTSHLASVLQVVLHSRALRNAVVEELQFGAAGSMANPIFSSLVGLLKQMFEAGGETAALDLTEFRFAVMEIAGYDQTIDHPNHILAILMDQISFVSMSVGAALGVDIRRGAIEFLMKRAAILVPFPASPSTRTRWSIKEMMQAHFAINQRITGVSELVSIAIDRNPGRSAERVDAYVETPMEMDFGGIMDGGEAHRFRLVGVVREINGKFVADYFDSDSGEWIHANDTHLHVIQGQPRNGGSDAVAVMYERL